MARNLPSPGWIIGVWIFTGVLSFFGALAYAELGAMIPATGGQYCYLREAYGPLWAFLCGWTYFFVVISAAIAWLSISFANYLGYFFPLTPALSKAVAIALIAAVTLVNYRGVTAGAAVQKTFTLMKVCGLAILIASAVLRIGALPRRPRANSPSAVSAYMISRAGLDGWSAQLRGGRSQEPETHFLMAFAGPRSRCWHDKDNWFPGAGAWANGGWAA